MAWQDSLITAKGLDNGCMLSPMLFNLYFNEISFLLDRKDRDPIVLPNRSNLNCLLYADDLVLISHSAKGLEKALPILSEYCDKWLLSVNSKKTKVMIFQKKHRKSVLHKHCFGTNKHDIKIVDNYTYLGTNFSANGNFKNCKLNSKGKVRRPFFAVRRYLNFSKVPLDITNKLFNSLFVSCCCNTIPWQGHEFSEEFLNVQGNIWAFLEYLCGQKKVLDHVVFEAPNLSWF